MARLRSLGFRLGFSAGLVLWTGAGAAWASEWIPERRKEQRQTTPGHILTPAAANIPGLGFTYGILGSAFNIRETESDVLGFRFWGDLSGVGLGVVDLPLLSDDLTLNVFWNQFDKAALESHRRGIDSRPEDRKYLELSTFSVYFAQLNWRLFERRLQLLAGINQQRSRLGAIRDKEGELVTEGNGDEFKAINRSVGSILDLTDDRSDPRRGGSLEIYRYDRPAQSSFEADFYQMEYNALGYVPVGQFSTWVFNLYRSDAIIQHRGETDPEQVRQRLNFQCELAAEGPAREDCRGVEAAFVKEQVAANGKGTAAPLGGTQRLRSYVTNRFSAAHSLAIGSEFRWNLTEEFTPFNIFVASGVRTGVQFALFGEGGTVAEEAADLDQDWRYSYGGGVRFILASGFVVRFDLAAGDEGTQPTLIFQYPWSVF